MTSIGLLFHLLNNTKKIIGKKGTQFVLNLFTRKDKFFSLNKIYDFDEKRTVVHLVLLLPGKGCMWAKKTGGCTMCGFSQKIKQIKKNFTDQDLINFYKIAELITLENKPVILTIYNAGSFINDDEISLLVQKTICQRVKKHSTVKKLFIESRAEFINEERIKSFKKNLGEKELIIGVGLESQDNKIRNKYIRKGLSKEMYENAIRIIKQNKAKALTYVFIKPVYLNERESIEEAMKTAKYAFKTGADEVAFESAFVQKGTLMEKLYREGKFRPPWLWSIIEVIRKTHHLGPIHLGGFEDEPPPIAIPHNCRQCSKKVRDALQIYRETNNIKVLDILNCDCKKKWRRIIKL